MKEGNMMMRKTLAILGPVLGFCLAAWITAAAQKPDSPSKPAAAEKSWDRVNRLSRQLKADDQETTGELVDAVMAHHGIDPAVSAIVPSMKDRLVRAELEFQSGRSKGVAEEDVVNAINDLGRKVKAPDFAQTNTAEVRQVRLRMLTLFPAMIGRGPSATRDDSNPHFDKSLSPIEAFHVGATLVTQKMFNPEFQLSPQELKAQNKTNTNRFASIPERDPERTHQMLSSVHQAITTMKLADIQSQCDKTLDLLGIGK
jgi:hypothetical protein